MENLIDAGENIVFGFFTYGKSAYRDFVQIKKSRPKRTTAKQVVENNLVRIVNA